MNPFKKIDRLTPESSLDSTGWATKILDKAMVAVGSYGDKAVYGACAVGMAGAIHAAAAGAIAYQVVQGVGQLRQIAGHLDGINNTLARDHALNAPPAFADFVYNMVKNMIGSSSSSAWYFVYHPDTYWTHHFSNQIRSDGPLGKRFIGIFQDLDMVVIFMRAMRQALASDPKMQEDPPHFKLLIPAYYPIVITSPLQFPKDLEPFSLYCDTHDGQPLVWMNLPGVEKGIHDNIGLYKPPQSLLSKLFGSKQNTGPRTLGTLGDPDGGKLYELTDRNVNIEHLAEGERRKYNRRASRSASSLIRENLARLEDDAPPAYDQHSFCNGNNRPPNRRNTSAGSDQKNEFARSSNEEYPRYENNREYQRYEADEKTNEFARVSNEDYPRYENNREYQRYEADEKTNEFARVSNEDCPRYENNREYQKYGTDEKMPLCGRNEFSRCNSEEYPKYANNREYQRYSDDEKRPKSEKSEFEHRQKKQYPKYPTDEEYQKYPVDEKRLRFEKSEFENCRNGQYPKYENDKEYQKYEVDERPPLCGRSKSQEYSRYHSTKEYQKSGNDEKSPRSSPRSSKDAFEKRRTDDYPKYKEDKEDPKDEEDVESYKWNSDDDMDNASTIASVAYLDEDEEEGEASDRKPRYHSRRHHRSSPRYSTTSFVSSLAPTESVFSSTQGSHKGYRKKRRRRRNHSRTRSKA
ncbi:uncharacterized protein KD926_003378 [Aspergillus affinis]|uniref:uncharacterized protein n=1 Tax=Aspergillus affinis TaxID=1070780 RepID=UPI0022FEF3AE|nr:uncharacterized protein KD926_003378 [Aspergillus affinis]KAI9043608.1 hypothetical protein KD926_003378 [Aspergillus affinis]